MTEPTWTLKDTLTIIVAGYGAALSTFLGLQQWQRDRRRIVIILDYIPFVEKTEMTITNIGHRPITISEVNISVKAEHQWEQIPRGEVIAQMMGPPDRIPGIIESDFNGETIEDGHSITKTLSIFISSVFTKNKRHVKIKVYDAEGHVYTKFKSRSHNPKTGQYSRK